MDPFSILKKHTSGRVACYKLVILVLTFIGIATVSFGQTTTSWKGTSSTAWGTSTNWTNGVPTSTSNVIVGDANFTGIYQPSLTTSTTVNSLTVGGTKASTFTLGAGITLNGTLTINSNGTLLDNGLGSSSTIKGDWINNGTYTVSGAQTIVFGGTNQAISGTSVTAFANLTINAGSIVTLNNNITVTTALSISGTLNPNETPAYVVSGTGTLTLNATGTMKVTAATTGGNYTISGTTTLSAGCTIDYSSTTVNQTINSSINYSNLNISGTTIKSLAASLNALNSSSTTYGNITVSSGTLDLSTFTANRGTQKTGGTLSVANGATLKIGGTNSLPSNYATISLAASSTIEYNGTVQSVTPATYGNLTLSNSGVKTLPASALTIAGDFTTAGTISTTAAASLNISGDVILGSGTTFNEGSYTHTIGGNWTNNGATVTPGTSTLNFNGSIPQTLGGTVANLSIYNLTISNTTAAVSVDINTNVTGTLNMNGANTLLTPAATTVFNSNAAAGTITGTGTIQVTRTTATADYYNQYKFNTNTLTNLTVDYAGAGDQLVNGLSYTNLKISGSGIKTASASPTITGTLNITSGATFDLSIYTISGTLTTYAGAGTLKTQNTSATPLPSGKTWTYTIYYGSSSPQTIVTGNYKDLNGTGGNRTLPSGTITISGTFTPGSGTYTAATGSIVDFNSTSAQTIAGCTYYNLTVSGAAVKTVGGSVTVVNQLTIAASTTLALGSNNITLKSDGTNTARVATVPSTASITYGTGRFIAERYVGSGRKYRLITSPVTTATGTLTTGQESLSIWGNWQDQGGNSSGVGTLITGGANADGYDTQTSNSSLYNYDATNKKWLAFSSANGKNTKYTPLKAGVGYYMFIYGDRVNAINAATPNNTVLRATGTINVGDQAYNTTSAIPLTNVVGNFTLLGNPFPSPIDWNAVTKTNVSNTVYGWERNLGGTGGYVTVTISALSGILISPISSIVGFNQYIQSGQAFFVKTTAASPSIIIKETDKVANNNTNAFRTTTPNSIPLMAINLLYNSLGTTYLADGAVEAYNAAFSSDVNDDDAIKMIGNSESVSIVNGANFLSINARPFHQSNDTLALNLTRITKPQYTLEIFAQQLDTTTLQPYLIDNYLNTKQPLSLIDTNHIVFNVTSDAASYGSNRFKIVYELLNALPVKFTTIAATKKGSSIEVDWTALGASDVEKYEVERSNDGITFSKVAEALLKGASTLESYNWLDTNPFAGYDYYRIKSVQIDGKFTCSEIALVKIEGSEAGIKIFPNPVTTQQINLALVNLPKGNYAIAIYSLIGERVYEKTIEHNGGSLTLDVTLQQKLAAGVYRLKVFGAGKSYSIPVLAK
jgi:hypothetical protein